MTDKVAVQLDESVLRDSQFSDVMGAIQMACPSQSQNALAMLEVHVQTYLNANAGSRFTAVKTAMLLLQVMLFVIRKMTESIIHLDKRNADLREEIGSLRTQLQTAELARELAQHEAETANTAFSIILSAIPNDAIIQHLMATTAELPALEYTLPDDDLDPDELNDDALDDLFSEDENEPNTDGDPANEDEPVEGLTASEAIEPDNKAVAEPTEDPGENIEPAVTPKGETT